jgi:hypothetical protein
MTAPRQLEDSADHGHGRFSTRCVNRDALAPVQYRNQISRTHQKGISSSSSSSTA